MTSGAQVMRWLVHRGWFMAFLVFLALRWTTLENILGVGVVRHWLYLVA
jgi:hypothetical protein